MARKRGRRRGTGSVIRVRRLGQLKQGEFGRVAMPVVVGGGVTALTTIAVHQMTPTTPYQMGLVRNAPLVGIGAGALASMAVWNLQSPGAGAGALTAALTVGLGLWAVEYAAKMRMANGAVAPNGTAGLRAIVPEYSMAGLGQMPGPGRPYFGQRRGWGSTGAIAMESHASRGYGAGPLGGRGVGSYGEVVNLGQVNASAFGTPGFTVG